MEEKTIKKLSEILGRARLMLNSLRNGEEKAMEADRSNSLISNFNTLIESKGIDLICIRPLHSWKGMAENENFAYKDDILGALSEIIGAIESLRELKLSQQKQSGDILRLINLAKNKLRKTIRSTPIEEKQLQDAFENILIGADMVYSRETDSIEYSSKTYTPDFTFPPLDLALEIKFCSNKKREKQIIAEINDDMPAYQIKYGNLIFLVYDLGFIRDVDKFSKSFEINDKVFVIVVKN